MANVREKVDVELENISAVLAELNFVHAYSFLLDESELRLLVDDVFDTYAIFKEEIDAFVRETTHGKSVSQN
jgi:hypothetical protein